MPKNVKYGGRVSVGGEARSKTLRVRDSVKEYVERFRDVLDNAEMVSDAVSMLEQLEKMAKESHNERTA